MPIESAAPPRDHLLAYLDLRLEADRAAGLEGWRQAFLAARAEWQIDLVSQLLGLLKRYDLPADQQATLRLLEGQWLSQQGRWSEALAACERSLQQRPDHVPTLSAKGTALRHLPGRSAEAITLLQQALDLAAADERAFILNNLGLTYYAAGQLDLARTALDEALTAYRAHHDQAHEADVLHNLGSIAWTRGELKAATEAFEQARQIYQRLNQTHAEAETINSLGLVQEAEGEWETAQASYRAALTMMQSVGDDFGQAQLLLNLGNVLTLQNDWAQARTCFDSGLILAQALGEADLEGLLRTGLADWLVAENRLDEALAELQNALALKSTAGDARSLKHTWLSLGAVYHHQHRWAEALETYRQAQQAAHSQGDQRIEAHALINQAKVALIQAQLATATELLDEAAALAEPREYYDALSDIALLRGDLELQQAEPRYEALLRYYLDALMCAENFNAPTSQRVLSYLIDLIMALAEDGQVSEMRQMAADFAAWADRIELPPQISAAFQATAQRLTQSAVT